MLVYTVHVRTAQVGWVGITAGIITVHAHPVGSCALFSPSGIHVSDDCHWPIFGYIFAAAKEGWIVFLPVPCCCVPCILQFGLHFLFCIDCMFFAVMLVMYVLASVLLLSLLSADTEADWLGVLLA
ncbi:hypothetical protein ABW21_db0209591 [Orbilia brochopaga]|nr:hypothetical protein ABW21_db0209591 [Drechslerella brochopaga]